MPFVGGKGPLTTGSRERYYFITKSISSLQGAASVTLALDLIVNAKLRQLISGLL